MIILNPRTLEFKSAEIPSNKLGHFQILKKEVEQNGSENIQGVIEEIEPEKLYKFPIQDFKIQEDLGIKISNTPTPSWVKNKPK